MKKLAGRWALVTGSSRGIGQQIALGLARLGCNVIVHGRDAEHCSATLAQVEALGVEAKVAAGSLDSAEQVDALIKDVLRLRPEGVDILYNNAAINNTPTPVMDFTAADWMHTFQVNVFALVSLSSALAPLMQARGWGRIINLTSGIAGQPNLAPYSASKAAVDKFTQDFACEFNDQNVLVNRVDPGWIRTDLGGPDAWDDVESTVPGVLVPALLPDHGPSGRFYAAQDFKDLWSL